MTTFYDHKKIEHKWQKIWLKEKINQAKNNKGEKKYILDMFPYPSGAGLHVGHPESYTATDIVARYYRFLGYNVLHPMGWDSFGLPAENYAIKSGIHPAKTTAESVNRFREQIQNLGFSYDWDREINTSSPEYYKWTQWLFLKLFENGLAYKRLAPVNWCNSCQTVLANEQVVDGKCERCSNPVIQKDLEQWFFKVTEYAEELLKEIDNMDWSDALKAAQRNWIGKSEGAEIDFAVVNSHFKIKVFTTRPDTLFGATYLVLSPENELVQKLKINCKNLEKINEYIKQASLKSNIERIGFSKEKTGIELEGVKAVNPGTGEQIPVWIADYVLNTYGTGAIMAVPAHDERDLAFAKKFKLPVVEVIAEGKLINSKDFTGLDAEKAKDKVVEFVGGKKQVQFKIRDWLVSRQRYWGAPIPIIYCESCGQVPVPEKDLPVLLPNDVDFKPTGESPLVRSKKFHNVKCPRCGAKARRESDTMDTFVCSSWYFLRYMDSHNEKEPFNKDIARYWLPVDLYIGGMEHAVGHLIYSRFIVKALRDMGYLEISEPFIKIRNQGIILAEDGRKMSKRWNNVINPDEVVEEFGADSMRIYEMFMGPLEDMKPWSQKGIIGVRRFLEKVYKFITLNAVEAQHIASQENIGLEKSLHKTIKKVTEDIEAIHFNTAISAMMIFMNDAVASKTAPKEIMEKFLIILSPFAPHLAEELWSVLGHKESIFKQSWPEYDKKLVINDEATIAIQINGKLRETIKVEAEIGEHELRLKVEGLQNIQKYLGDKKINKFIYIKGKVVNIVM